MSAEAQTLASRNAHAKTAFSWEGEDLIVHKVAVDVLGIKEGIYIDVGAHHPHAMSNTQYLYDRGWHGINIDAMPGSMEPFKIMRPLDINLEVGIARHPGQLEYSMFSNPSLNGFLTDDVVRTQVARGSELLGQIVVEVQTLSAVLEAHAIDQVDFLTIDAEGLDEEIFKSLDLTRWRPRLVMMEILGASDVISVQSSSTNRLMTENNYTLYSRMHFSALYMDRALLA